MKIVLRSKWFWITVFCLFGGAAFFLIYHYDSQVWARVTKLYNSLYSPYRLKRIIISYGAYSPLAYVILQVLQVVIAPIPGGAVEFLGGYLFGVNAGFAYSMIGLTLGAALAFGLARIFERVAVERFVSPETRKKFDYLIGHEGTILSFLLFLIPGFPKDALCYILGLTPMRWGIFLLVSTIGRIPGTLMACLQGAKAFDHQYKALIILSGISALLLLVFYIYHEEIHQMIKRLKKTKGGVTGEGR